MAGRGRRRTARREADGQDEDVRTATDRPILDVDLIRTRYACHERLGGAVDHDDGIFDEETAAEYDDASDPMFDPAVVGAAVDLLAELAGDGPALELGIGTGRIALPLAARGSPSTGSTSRPMVARLRAKPGGADVPVTIGDFATADLAGAGPFTLVYLVYNTVMNLTTQAAQVDAFRNAARHLAPGGSLPHRGRRGPAAPATGRAVCRVRWRRPLGRG